MNCRKGERVEMIKEVKGISLPFTHSSISKIRMKQ